MFFVPPPPCWNSLSCFIHFSPMQDGRAHVLAHPTGITVIAQSIRTRSIKTKILGLPTQPPPLPPSPPSHTHTTFSKHKTHFYSTGNPWSTVPGPWRAQESSHGHGTLSEVCSGKNTFSGTMGWLTARELRMRSIQFAMCVKNKETAL